MLLVAETQTLLSKRPMQFRPMPTAHRSAEYDDVLSLHIYIYICIYMCIFIYMRNIFS